MSRLDGESEARPPVFKSPRKIGTHLSTTAVRMKGCVDLAQPGNRTRTCGGEARYTTTRPLSLPIIIHSAKRRQSVESVCAIASHAHLFVSGQCLYEYLTTYAMYSGA
ncbi:hypothetical protein TNCV_4559041 [Trichonephila clavipes]|nr:hypothetical protein TNCV_4559041 [Trichonephila clavipes]